MQRKTRTLLTAALAAVAAATSGVVVADASNHTDLGTSSSSQRGFGPVGDGPGGTGFPGAGGRVQPPPSGGQAPPAP